MSVKEDGVTALEFQHDFKSKDFVDGAIKPFFNILDRLYRMAQKLCFC